MHMLGLYGPSAWKNEVNWLDKWCRVQFFPVLKMINLNIDDGMKWKKERAAVYLRSCQHRKLNSPGRGEKILVKL